MPQSDVLKAERIFADYCFGDGSIECQLVARMLPVYTQLFGKDFSIKNFANSLGSLSQIALELKEKCEAAARK